MTHPNPKDPQADIREAIAKILDRDIPDNDEQEAALIDDLIALFQARQQELLRELLGELPEKYLGLQPKDDRLDPKVRELWDSYYRFYGFNQAIDQVVSVIKSKIGELNG